MLRVWHFRWLVWRLTVDDGAGAEVSDKELDVEGGAGQDQLHGGHLLQQVPHLRQEEVAQAIPLVDLVLKGRKRRVVLRHAQPKHAPLFSLRHRSGPGLQRASESSSTDSRAHELTLLHAEEGICKAALKIYCLMLFMLNIIIEVDTANA